MEDGHVLKKTSHEQINVVKILKKNVLINFDEFITEITLDKDNNIVKEEKYTINHPLVYNYPPHQDFLDAMCMLRKPLIDILGFKGEMKNHTLYTVHSVYFHGMDNDETATVMIGARKKIERSGQEWNMQPSPQTSLFDPDKYADCELLDKWCKKIVDEANAYRNGKHAAQAQMKLELEFEDGTTSKMHVEQLENEEEAAMAINHGILTGDIVIFFVKEEFMHMNNLEKITSAIVVGRPWKDKKRYSVQILTDSPSVAWQAHTPQAQTLAEALEGGVIATRDQCALWGIDLSDRTQNLDDLRASQR